MPEPSMFNWDPNKYAASPTTQFDFGTNLAKDLQRVNPELTPDLSPSIMGSNSLFDSFGSQATATHVPTWWEKLMGSKEYGEGALNPIVNLLGTGANAFLAFEGLKATKDQTKEAKRQFDLNFGASKDSYNKDVYDQGLARERRNPNNMTADEYVSKFALL